MKIKVETNHKVSFSPAEPFDENLERKVTFVHGNKIDGTWKDGNLHGHVIISYETGEYF